MNIKKEGDHFILKLSPDEVIGLRVDFLDVLLGRKKMSKARYIEYLYKALCGVDP